MLYLSLSNYISLFRDLSPLGASVNSVCLFTFPFKTTIKGEYPSRHRYRQERWNSVSFSDGMIIVDYNGEHIFC